MSDDLPGAVLFACGQNCIRSPMAEGLMKHFYGHRVHVQSCGVKIGKNDMFVQAVMDEMGIDLSSFHPRSFEELEDTNFDLVITLSPRAHHKAMEMTRTMAIEVEYWPTMDPSTVAGSRQQVVDAYRATRNSLENRIRDRFKNN
ncbi:MAG: hypothetical protein L3J32_07695 [Rhizobiaceae bacterium]|nr:hypothetical protein [Rhizobiaceae bacterium]